MSNIIAVTVNKDYMRPHELDIITEAPPAFLPRVTLAESDGQKAFLYACESLTPLCRFGEGPGVSLTLGLLFEMLTGYIRSLSAARDRLLDTRLLSSDPEKGVFIGGDASGRVAIRVLWGGDKLTGEGEKVCRIAETLAGYERVMGARISMERMISIIRSENLSLRDCLKAAESVCREWSDITL